MIFTGNAGQWQSRVSSPNPADTQHQVVQCGHVWPITLPNVLHSATACTLQQLVDAWHSQAQVHGLSDLSRFVALQIPRFGPDGSRVLGQINAPWQVHLPYFTDPSMQPIQLSHMRVRTSCKGGPARSRCTKICDGGWKEACQAYPQGN